MRTLKGMGMTATLWVGLCFTPDVAHAYTIQNTLSRGCHEEITTAALRAVRLDLQTAAPMVPRADDKALIDDLQFTPAADMKDLGGATLLIAVRDNDLKGRGADDLSQLSAVHGDPTLQQEHCLRGESDKEPTGTQTAVATCQAFIRSRIVEALAGLDASGAPDPTQLTSLKLMLSARGQVDALLPTYWVKIGQAIHAIEDSFTHTYRTPDERQITVTLNWIDKVGGTLDESRDGPAHAAALDRCDDPDALRTTRHALAIAAAEGVLRATLDPTQTTIQKLAAVDAVLAMYLSYSPGCTFANNWCDAPERQYADSLSGCGCMVGKTEGTFGAVIGASLLALLGVRRSRRRSGRTAVAALTVAGLALLAPLARAQDATPVPSSTQEPPPPPSPPSNTHEPPPPTVVPVKEPGPRDPSKMAFGAYLGASGSIDKASMAGTLGLRLRVSKHWTFGLDGEWNPWISITGGSLVRAGVANFYATAMLRFPLAYENFNLRTSISAGASVLLMDLYGAPAGSVGPYLGVSFIGLEWKLSRAFFLIVNPLNIALPIPQVQGVPLTYPEYRFTLGLEMYFG